MKKPNLVQSVFRSLSNDAFLLLTCLVCIPLTWMIFLGWEIGSAATSHDTLPGIFLSLKSLFSHHGDWTSYLYRPDLMGGFKLHDVSGCLPIFEFCGLLGLSPIASINLTVFFIQTCIAFLGSHAALSLYFLWNQPEHDGPGEKAPDPSNFWFIRIGLVWLFAFAPVIGWRLCYGHYFLITGSFFFFSTVALYAAALTDRISYPLILIATLANIHFLTASGFQGVAYTAVFGCPIILGLFLPPLLNLKRESKSQLKGLVVATAVLVAGVLLNFRHFAGLLDHSLGSDASRTLNGESVIYSYTTANLWDWITSIPWSKSIFNLEREFPFHHETNYPLGPLLLLLAFIPWKKAKGLGVGLLISLGLAIPFSMNVEPVASLLPKLIPLLLGFRVPARAILPFAFTVPIVATAGLLYYFMKGPNRYALNQNRSQTPFILAGCGAAILLLMSPPELRELLLWFGVMAMGAATFIDRKNFSLFPLGWVMMILGLGTVLSFKERLLPYPTEEQIVITPDRIGAEILSKAPSLSNALVRARFNLQIPLFGLNTGYAVGVSTLDGYNPPSFRFLSLVAALKNEPVQRMTMVMVLQENEPIFPILKNLYNVQYRIDADQTGIKPLSLGPTLGGAWFSEKIERVNSFQELGNILRPLSTSASTLEDFLRKALKERTFMIVDQASRNIPGTLQGSSRCQEARVLDAQALRGEQIFRVKVSTPGDCPLTLATNWASDLVAETQDGTGKTLRGLITFPSYGALMGVWVPQGTTELVVRAVPVLPFWANFGFFLGVLVVLVVLGEHYYRRI